MKSIARLRLAKIRANRYLKSWMPRSVERYANRTADPAASAYYDRILDK